VTPRSGNRERSGDGFRRRSIDVSKKRSVSTSKSKKRHSRRPASWAPMAVLPTQLTPAMNMRILQCLMRLVAFLVDLAIIDDSCRALAGLSTGAANTGRIGSPRDRPLSINPPACDQTSGAPTVVVPRKRREQVGIASRAMAWLVIAPRRSSSAHRHRPWRAILRQSTLRRPRGARSQADQRATRGGAFECGRAR